MQRRIAENNELGACLQATVIQATSHHAVFHDGQCESEV